MDTFVTVTPTIIAPPCHGTMIEIECTVLWVEAATLWEMGERMRECGSDIYPVVWRDRIFAKWASAYAGRL